MMNLHLRSIMGNNLEDAVALEYIEDSTLFNGLA